LSKIRKKRKEGFVEIHYFGFLLLKKIKTTSPTTTTAITIPTET
jgi:hypothetical protein